MTESESGTTRTPYDLMDSEPEAAGIRALHPPTLDSSREKLRLFLTGWRATQGPQAGGPEGRGR